jgi:hypothetical protein
VLLLLLGAAGASAAAPRPANTELQDLVDAADELFRAGDHAAALAGYQEALRRSPLPALHYPIGRCLQELGRLPEALASFETFLAGPAPAAARIKVEHIVAQLRRQLAQGRLVLQVEPFGAAILVDGELVGRAPLPPWPVTPGEHELVVRQAGYQEDRRRVSVPGGGELVVVVLLAPLAEVVPSGAAPPALAAEPPAAGAPGGPVAAGGSTAASPGAPPAAGLGSPAPPGAASRLPALLVLGAGLACGAVGGTLLVLGDLDHGAIEEAPGYGSGEVVQMTRSRALALEASGDGKKRWGTILAGAGGAAVAAAGLLVLLRPTTAGPVAVTLQPGPGGFALQGRF